MNPKSKAPNPKSQTLNYISQTLNPKAADEIFLNRNAGKNHHGDMRMDFHGLRKVCPKLLTPNP